MSFPLEILTPSKTLLKGEAKEVIAPSTAGEVGILGQHADYLTLLTSGTLKVTQPNDQKTEFRITGGVLAFIQNRATVLVDEIMEKQT